MHFLLNTSASDCFALGNFTFKPSKTLASWCKTNVFLLVIGLFRRLDHSDLDFSDNTQEHMRILKLFLRVITSCQTIRMFLLQIL